MLCPMGCQLPLPGTLALLPYYCLMAPAELPRVSAAGTLVSGRGGAERAVHQPALNGNHSSPHGALLTLCPPPYGGPESIPPQQLMNWHQRSCSVEEEAGPRLWKGLGFCIRTMIPGPLVPLLILPTPHPGVEELLALVFSPARETKPTPRACVYGVFLPTLLLK